MTAASAMKAVSDTPKGRATALAVAVGLFAIWGLALWLFNALYYRLAHFFDFATANVVLSLSLFQIAYFLLAIPAALFHSKFGYKLGFLFGLSVFALGAFILYLAIIEHSSLYFLGAVVMIGVSGAWLDTSLNPLAVEAGNPQTAVLRLNFAHAFNGLGLFAGYVTAWWLIEMHYQLSVGATAHLSARPYVMVGLGAILLAFLIEQIPLPAFASNRTMKGANLRAELRPPLGDRSFRIACAALFAYTVVLTILWTANYNYRVQEVPGHGADLIERGFFWFAVGRCVGTALMRWIDPLRLLQASAGLCLIAISVAALAGGMTGWVCLLSASFFLSIMYPTVFATALAGQWSHMKIAAGLLVAAAGIGNALSSLLVTPALQAANVRTVVLTALPFLAVILIYALRAHTGRVAEG